MARQEAKHARICLTKRRRADHKSPKNLLRHAKVPKSQSLFYGEIGSQACQDLLDQAKASRPQKFQKSFKTPKSQNLFYGEIGSQACQDLLDQAKACIPQKFQKSSKARKGSKISKPVLWRDRKPSMSGSTRPSEGEQTIKVSKIL